MVELTPLGADEEIVGTVSVDIACTGHADSRVVIEGFTLHVYGGVCHIMDAGTQGLSPVQIDITWAVHALDDVITSLALGGGSHTARPDHQVHYTVAVEVHAPLDAHAEQVVILGGDEAQICIGVDDGVCFAHGLAVEEQGLAAHTGVAVSMVGTHDDLV